ncbi:MAG: DUF547 domain-containing protein [Bacteriovoracia bacterium]
MLSTKKYYSLVLFCSSFLLLAVGPCQDEGTRYSFNEVSSSAFTATDEADYDALLQRYMDANNYVRYAQWRGDGSDRARLSSILDSISKADDSAMKPDERKAFYINAYNAMTIDLILSRYDETLGGGGSSYPSQRSIRNIAGLDSRVWDHFKWKVAGKNRSLNDIEHRILRPLGDARIHFAIVCASKGCPPLHGHAFSQSSVNTVLDELADAFVNSGRSTAFDIEKKTIDTSQILNWFESDFRHSFGSLHGMFAHYVRVIPTGDVSQYQIGFKDYDWTLNESVPGSGTERDF